MAAIFDLSTDKTFNTKYAPLGSLMDAGTDAFQDYLNAALKNKVAKDYGKHCKIYFIDEEEGGLFGRAYDIPAPANSRSVIALRPGPADSTLAHETFHAMGLYHTFDDNGKFTFEQFKTDNIMDYSDIGPSKIPVTSTWQWGEHVRKEKVAFGGKFKITYLSIGLAYFGDAGHKSVMGPGSDNVRNTVQDI